MGLDVKGIHVNVQNNKVELINNNLFDFLPYDLRWSLQPYKTEDFDVVADVESILEDSKFVGLEDIVDKELEGFIWCSIITASDFHKLAEKYDAVEECKCFPHEGYFIVGGDQY